MSAPVEVEMEVPRAMEQMVYQAPGKAGRPEAEWARGVYGGENFES